MSIPLSLLAAVLIGNTEPVSGILPVVHSPALTTTVAGVPAMGAEGTWYRSMTLYLGIAAVSMTFAYALGRKRRVS